jgi:S1-C subfamily serine protease
VITAIDGTAVTNASQSERRDRREEPRRPVRLTYLRDGKTKTATVTLGTRPS